MSTMRTVALTKESTKDILENLLKRSPNNYGKFESAVDEILHKVKTEGDSALFAVPAPILLISKRLVQQFRRGHGLRSFARPCIRIVAELTPERTALQKNHIAHPGSIDQAEALERMHPTHELTCGHGRYGQ